jgi:hypothetical protein
MKVNHFQTPLIDGTAFQLKRLFGPVPKFAEGGPPGTRSYFGAMIWQMSQAKSLCHPPETTEPKRIISIKHSGTKLRELSNVVSSLLDFGPTSIPGNLKHSWFEREDILAHSHHFESHALVCFHDAAKVIWYEGHRKIESLLTISGCTQESKITSGLVNNRSFNLAGFLWCPDKL